MINKYINKKGEPVNYSCGICDHMYMTKKEAKKCEDDCGFMIKCYMDNSKLMFEEAKKIFLMELI